MEKKFKSLDQFVRDKLKVQKVLDNIFPVTQLAKPFNPKLIIAEMCNISFPDISLEHFEKEPNFSVGQHFWQLLPPNLHKIKTSAHVSCNHFGKATFCIFDIDLPSNGSDDWMVL